MRTRKLKSPNDEEIAWQHAHTQQSGNDDENDGRDADERSEWADLFLGLC